MNIAWNQEQRFRFIERHLLWGRKLQVRMIRDAFSVSRYQAGLDIKAYQKLAPENIKPYAPADRCYKPTLNFLPIFTPHEPQELLSIVKGGWRENSSLEAVPQLHRNIKEGVLPAIMAALEHRWTVEVIYASATSPLGKKRVITPTAIAYVDNRIHIRAYCDSRKEYRDFVLSRFLTVPSLLDDASGAQLPEDSKWNEKLIIKLIANPALNKDARTLIEREYGIDNFISVEVRKTLVHYFLQTNLLPYSQDSLDSAEKTPWAFPLAIENWTEVSVCLF